MYKQHISLLTCMYFTGARTSQSYPVQQLWLCLQSGWTYRGCNTPRGVERAKCRTELGWLCYARGVLNSWHLPCKSTGIAAPGVTVPFCMKRELKLWWPWSEVLHCWRLHQFFMRHQCTKENAKLLVWRNAPGLAIAANEAVWHCRVFRPAIVQFLC